MSSMMRKMLQKHDFLWSGLLSFHQYLPKNSHFVAYILLPKDEFAV